MSQKISPQLHHERSHFLYQKRARFIEQNALSFFLLVVVLRVLRVLVVIIYKEEYNNASITVELCIQEEEEKWKR